MWLGGSMPLDKKLAILDYDSNPQAIIQPSQEDYDFTLPSKCIAIFFRDIVDELAKSPYVTEIGRVPWETGEVIYYLYKKGEVELCFYHSWVGASISAAVMDLTIALGAQKIIACGGCGVLDNSIDEGRILVPTKAIRDEGTSFHYAAPSSEISCENELLTKLVEYLKTKNIPHALVKTWTTDGFYRETEQRRRLRVQQGCSTVDMEFSALCSVAQFRRIDFAQLFYAGDVVELAEQYDERNWQSDKDTRKNLVNLILNFIGDIS